MNRVRTIVAIIACFSVLPAYAGFGDFLKGLGDRAKEGVESAVQNKEDDTVDKAAGKVLNGELGQHHSAAGNATAGSAPAADQGQVQTASPLGNARAGSAPPADQGQVRTASPSGSDAGQPNLVATKIDFVPGDKTIFFDNFHDMPPGEPPPHWKVRGGRVDLLMGKGVRALRIPAGVSLTSGSLPIPADFTMQVVFVPKPGFNDASGFLSFEFRNKRDSNVFSGQINVKYTSVSLDNRLGSVHTTYDANKPNEFDLWSQQGRVRVYLNGARLIDVNQVHPGAMDHLYLTESQGTFELRSIRIAKSAPDPGDVLATTGKYVTHGIYFDTDSARLEPASAGVIKEISTALYKHPDMKLEIDGYTDSTGNASHNQELSQKRAEAVMKVLVSQFGIDQGRLTAKGYGSQNPIASNNTSEGRAENRRVEFIKHGTNAGGLSDSGAGFGAGATASTSAGQCNPPTVPTGTKLFPAYVSGSKNYVPLKPPERVAYLMLLSIRKLEERCNDELHHYCTLSELVKGVQGSARAFNGPLIALSANPACDTHYSYDLKTVPAGWRLTIEPRSAGLGGFLDDEGEPPGTGIYYNPSGAATKLSHKLHGNGWGVGPHAQGGDFEHKAS